MLKSFGGLAVALLTSIFATVPTSTNYTLKAFDFGTGGGSSSSTSYNLNAITNGQTGLTSNSVTYMNIGPGLIPTQNANVPPAPTFTNPNSYYNKLKIVLNNGNNPTDAKFAIAVSPDNFVTTYYVQPDDTLSLAFSFGDYQTYSAWGGAGGFYMLGLQPNTTYKAKVKAIKGNFTETAYGPTSTASTVNPSISFSIATTLTSTPPLNIDYNNLAPGSVYSTNYDPILSLSTNALFGGVIYFNDQYSGLKSLSSSYTLSSSTTDLSAALKGYGAQVSGVSQVSGGPLSSLSPYNGSTNNVGAISNSLQPIISTSNPVTTGSANIKIKAKTDITVPSAGDYSDALTFVAAMIF